MYKSLQCEEYDEHQFYALEGEIKPDDCPICGGDLKCVRVVKHKPKRRGTDERSEVPHIKANFLDRARDQFDKKQKKAKEDRASLYRQDSALDAEFSSSDFDDGSDSGTELGEDELPYLPGETFKPNMRFTDSGGPRYAAGHRDLKTVATDATYTKIMNASVQDSAVRASANGVMGRSAHEASGRGVAKSQNDAYRGDHEEWCHLIADCLGGPTQPHNLVAASAACNSYMLNIECCLRGKSHVSLVVTAHCSSIHVAEWIKYEMKSKGKTLVKEIDATSKYFTRDDGNELRAEVLKFCK